MPRNTSWTDIKVARLRALWGTTTTTVIAERLGVSVNAVMSKAHRLGLWRRNKEVTYAYIVSVSFNPEDFAGDVPTCEDVQDLVASTCLSSCQGDEKWQRMMHRVATVTIKRC
jgi:hypothetical protein